MRLVFVTLRVVFAAAIAIAAFSQMAHSIAFRASQGATDAGFFVVNFFSFFTIESNLLSVVALLIGAVVLLVRQGDDPGGYTVLRAIAVTYMTVTFVVYNLLLRNVELPQGTTLEWANEILHVVGPLFVVVDWLFAPGRRRIEWRKLWLIVAFPILWVIYTLVRGTIAIDELTGAPWYPYPFLNPEISPNGYLSVAFYVLLIAGVMLGVGAGAIWVSRRDRWPLRAAKG
jgi:carbon starvation protein CstA